MKKGIILILLISITSLSFAQKFSVKYFDNQRKEGSLSYNFFIGEDAELFQTTILGFGSGFIFDVFTGRSSMDIITIGWDKVNLSLGAGLAISKYRFQKNLIFENDMGLISVYEDPNINHDYVNTFFGYGKSKLVYGSLYAPINLDITVGKFLLSGGAFLDFWLSGKHKRKYIEEGDRIKTKIGNSEFRNYNISKTKLGVNGMIKHIPSGVYLVVTHMITPFFNDVVFMPDVARIPKLNEMRIAFGIDIGKDYVEKIKKKTKLTKRV